MTSHRRSIQARHTAVTQEAMLEQPLWQHEVTRKPTIVKTRVVSTRIIISSSCWYEIQPLVQAGSTRFCFKRDASSPTRVWPHRQRATQGNDGGHAGAPARLVAWFAGPWRTRAGWALLSLNKQWWQLLSKRCGSLRQLGAEQCSSSKSCTVRQTRTASFVSERSDFSPRPSVAHPSGGRILWIQFIMSSKVDAECSGTRMFSIVQEPSYSYN